MQLEGFEINLVEMTLDTALCVQRQMLKIFSENAEREVAFIKPAF